jgi:predicted ATPase with chaperone activity
MKKFRAIWRPKTVLLECRCCFGEVAELTLAEVKHLGQTAIRCETCRSLNIIPSDLIQLTKGTQAKVDPDNPPGRAQAWDNLVGNPWLRRGLEVALIGYHTLTYVGRPGNGWEQVKEILGERASIMQRCPCGNLFNIRSGSRPSADSAECTCTHAEIMAHRATKLFKLALGSDLIVEVLTPRVEELFAEEEPYFSVYQRIKRVRGDQVWVRASMNVSPSEEPFKLLNWARTRFEFDKDMLRRTQIVACTICEMRGGTVVSGADMSEAISFRTALIDY